MPWLSNYEKRIKLTLDNTNVDDTLSDFPVLVKLSDSSGISSTDVTSVFTELGSDVNRKKIAITTSDEITQCYVEIERFDYSNSVAELWVKVPTVVSGTTTDLYFYYGSDQTDNTDYIGDTGDTPAQSVWDSNFKLVCHAIDDTTSTVKDSTSNTNNGTKSSANNPIEANAKIGLGQDFSDDLINFGDNSSLDITGNVTVEGILNLDAVPGSGKYPTFLGRHSDFTGYGVSHAPALGIRMQLGYDGGWIDGTPKVITTSTDYYYAGVYDGSYVRVYINSVEETPSVAHNNGSSATSNPVKSGGHYSDPATYGYVDGKQDEFRISGTARSASWIKATYYSNWDGLISFGSEEAAVYYYYGYVTEEELPVSRTVMLYYRDTGELIDTTTSSGSNGYYYLTTTISSEHFIVTIDNDVGKDYNALILDRLLPRGIE